MIGTHVISDPVFDALAAGGGGPEAVRLLRQARRSRNLLLLRRILDGPCAAAAEPAADLLARVERAAPAVARSVIDASSFGTWAARAASDCPAHRHAGCTARDLGALAAVAAVRAGLGTEITVPVHDGTLRLPGLGTATRLGPVGEALVVVTTRPEAHPGPDGPPPGPRPTRFPGCQVDIRLPGEVRPLPRDPGRAGHDWQPVAFLEARHRGLALRVPLETADPRLPSLDTASARPAAWQELLRSAWRLLVDSHPGRAEELAAGLGGIVPLPAPARGVTSATSRHAFGTVLASWPADPDRLALTLLHEFQHSKLSALADLVILHEPDGRPRLYAPWRPDPRPPAGLLQGIYAHLGDLAFWQHRSASLPEPERADAAWRLALTRAQAERGVTEAASRLRLTRLGARFLDRAARTVRAVSPDPGPARVAARVEAGVEAVWRLRWAEADGTGIKQLAELWRARLPAGALPADDIRPASGPVSGPGPEFGRWAAKQRGAHRAPPAREAAEAVAAQPDRAERWAGLAASAAEERLPGAGVLRRRTEVVRDLYRELTTDGGTPEEARPPDPLALAAWLAGAPVAREAGAGPGQSTGV
ncbi:HEXXH motif-containing putative peptide modification protein [Streptomyces sp. NPDC052107]|uniref:aKG-HExxH-type peptide beta-hydroxylase n=1 Tax=Streptomyces sp. NPDC052107 TaxID=3155632 RepID=UPI0034234F66